MNGQVNNFGTIDNTAVFSATTSSTTVSSGGTVYMKIYDDGSGANPGLWKNPDLIESPWATMTDASATISAGMEGYGIQATDSAGTILINARYDKASYTGWVGALEQGVGAAVVVASSDSAQTSQQVDINYKTTVAISTPGGAYADTVTFICSATP